MDAVGVRRVARLARLRLGDEEERALAQDLHTILEHFRALESVEAGGLSTPPAGALREDAPAPAAPVVVERILEAAPRHEGRFVRVPRGVGE